MKLEKTRKAAWKFLKPNETMLIMFGIFTVLAIVTGVSMYRRETKFEGNLVYQNLSSEQRRQAEKMPEIAKVGEDDTSFRLSERIREASAVGLGLSMYLVHERISDNRVLTLQQMMSEFSKSDLLPPAAVVLFPDRQTDYGIVKTALGAYFVRYSPAPLKIEILSSGFQGLGDGATFIIRLPDTSAASLRVTANSPKVTSAGAWATLFLAPENENHYIPAPFSPVQTFAAMNWQITPLQQTELSPAKVQELNTFLQSKQ